MDDSFSSADEGEDQGVDLLQDSFPIKQEFVPSAPAGGGGGRDDTVLRPGFQVTQGVSYYNLVSLYILYYAHVTEGVPIPAIFSPSGDKGFDKPDVKFNF